MIASIISYAQYKWYKVILTDMVGFLWPEHWETIDDENVFVGAQSECTCQESALYLYIPS